MVSIQLGFHVLKINDLKPLFLVIDLCFVPEGAWAGLVAAVGMSLCLGAGGAGAAMGHISLGDVLLCPVSLNPLRPLCCFGYSPLEQQ